MDNQEPTTERIKYPSLMKLKRRELANHFAAMLNKGTPRLVVNEIRDIVLTQKEKLRRQRIHEAQQNILWGELIKPLQAERRSVRASLKYERGLHVPDGEARLEALHAYGAVLSEVYLRITKLKREAKFTPSTYAKEKNLPNHGLHWTDFVPLHIKQRIVEAFDEIPHKPKAKRKIPFERVVTEDIHIKRKRRLLERTTKELLHANQDHAIEPTPETQQRVHTLKQALRAIEHLDPTEPVPTTWHGLI